MSTPGTKPAPVSLQLLKGKGDGKDSGGREIKHPPKFKREAPAKPDTLSDLAACMWDQIVEELEGLDVLKRIDGPALAMACETYAAWHDARDLRIARGLTTSGSTGQLTTAPWVTIERAAAKDFRAWCSEFGLTPSAEMRLAKGSDDGADEDNPFAGN